MPGLFDFVGSALMSKPEVAMSYLIRGATERAEPQKLRDLRTLGDLAVKSLLSRQSSSLARSSSVAG
jgi:hypothetical protein